MSGLPRRNPSGAPPPPSARLPHLSAMQQAFVWVLLAHVGLFLLWQAVLQLAPQSQAAQIIVAQLIALTPAKRQPPAPERPDAPAPMRAAAPPSAANPPPPPTLPTPNPALPNTTPANPVPALGSVAPPALTAPAPPAPPTTAPGLTPGLMPATTPPGAAPPGTHTKPVPRVVAASAKMDSCEEPRYPAASVRLREEGVVSLKFLIGENGRVLSGSIDQSSGHKRLDEAALSALSLCQFRPATVDGKPRQEWSSVRYRWQLNSD